MQGSGIVKVSSIYTTPTGNFESINKINPLELKIRKQKYHSEEVEWYGKFSCNATYMRLIIIVTFHNTTD